VDVVVSDFFLRAARNHGFGLSVLFCDILANVISFNYVFRQCPFSQTAPWKNNPFVKSAAKFVITTFRFNFYEQDVAATSSNKFNSFLLR